MNRKITVLILCLCGWTSIGAQTGNRAKATEKKRTAEECLNLYYYDEAETLLNQTLTQQKRKRQSTETTIQMLEQVERGRNMLHATERVVFIDSFVVAKEQYLQALRISSESGRVTSYASFFNRPDSLGCTVYVSELGNKLYFSEPDHKGQLHLYTSDLIGDAWTQPTPLSGLNEGSASKNFPFMLSDGITLYYAAEGDESLGGYDIFVSRYDADSKQFLRPENIGMPFNSPANDYLFAWDEYNHLGWFVTDRNQPHGKVCVYVFIPNETREIYSTAKISTERLRQLALLHSIAETWTDMEEVNAARQRLQQALNETPRQHKKHDFVFVIDDAHTYTLLSDFQSPEAKKMAQWWKEGTADLAQKNQLLDELRDAYHSGNKPRREQLAPQIVEQEKQVELLLSDLRRQEKNIRKAEITFLRR